MNFSDRGDAGKQLAEALLEYQGEDVVILGVPPGGVVVGYYVAKRLRAPLDLYVTSEVTSPESASTALCSITRSGSYICAPGVFEGIDRRWLREKLVAAWHDARDLDVEYHRRKKPLTITEKVVIVVDEWIATELMLELIIYKVKKQRPSQIILAAPVATERVIEKLQNQVDRMVILKVPFQAPSRLSAYYDELELVTDREVCSLLEQS